MNDNLPEKDDRVLEITQRVQQQGKRAYSAVLSFFVKFITIAAIYGITIVLAVKYVAPLASWGIENFSPLAQQRKQIEQKNNVRDAFSTISNTNVGVISNSSITQFFTNKEAKEIDISIPKLINNSPIFDDDSHNTEIRDAFAHSINWEYLGQSTKQFTVSYNGSLLAKKDKNGTTFYTKLTEPNTKEILSDVKKQLKNHSEPDFVEWEKIDDENNYDIDKNKKSVTVSGYYESKRPIPLVWKKPVYHVKATYNLEGFNYEFKKGSLKVEERKK